MSTIFGLIEPYFQANISRNLLETKFSHLQRIHNRLLHYSEYAKSVQKCKVMYKIKNIRRKYERNIKPSAGGGFIQQIGRFQRLLPFFAVFRIRFILIWIRPKIEKIPTFFYQKYISPKNELFCYLKGKYLSPLNESLIFFFKYMILL